MRSVFFITITRGDRLIDRSWDTDRGLTCRNRQFSGSFIPFNDDAVGAGDVL
jgi:hypothetical protein